MADKLMWPVGDADKIQVASTATINASVSNRLTILEIDTLTTAGTLNITIDPQVPIGSTLVIKVPCGSPARDLTLGTGLTGTVVTGVANKTKYVTALYDGVTFVVQSVNQVN